MQPARRIARVHVGVEAASLEVPTTTRRPLSTMAVTRWTTVATEPTVAPPPHALGAASFFVGLELELELQQELELEQEQQQ